LGAFSYARPREAEARRVRAETVPGPGGRRGFYARLIGLSTTFSRKKRISQDVRKHLKNQHEFSAPKVFASLRNRLGAATALTYRFPFQASSAIQASQKASGIVKVGARQPRRNRLVR
jgi:hypothetical protein